MIEIIDLIPTDIRSRWDGANCEISTPITLGDEATVVVRLFNKDGSKIVVAFDLHEGVEIERIYNSVLRRWTYAKKDK